jgi:hypothetical protein
LPLHENKDSGGDQPPVEIFVDYFSKAAPDRLILDLAKLHSFLVATASLSFSITSAVENARLEHRFLKNARSADSGRFPQFKVNGV